jgi:hypothetical protein
VGERRRGQLIASRSAAEAEIDAVGMQRLEDAETVRHVQ